MDKNVDHAINAAFIGYNELREPVISKPSLISKGGVDAYTTLDKELERRAREHLASVSGINVFGEEEGGSKTSRYLWVIDKIDGTPNWRNGLPEFGSFVGLLDGDNCDISAIVLPKMGELYLAVREKGTFLIELDDKFNPGKHKITWDNICADNLGLSIQKLNTSKETNPKNTIIGADLSYDNRKEKLAKVAKYSEDVFYCPIFGSVSYSLCQVSSGKLDGYMIFDVDINDLFNGELLVSEAGGITTDLDGNQVTRKTRTLVAAGNKEIHKFLIDKLRE